MIEVLRATRSELGVSQRELARRLGKHPSYVNKVEIFERRLDVLEFVVFARAMGIEPTALLKKMLETVPAEFELG